MALCRPCLLPAAASIRTARQGTQPEFICLVGTGALPALLSRLTFALLCTAAFQTALVFTGHSCWTCNSIKCQKTKDEKNVILFHLCMSALSCQSCSPEPQFGAVGSSACEAAGKAAFSFLGHSLDFTCKPETAASERGSGMPAWMVPVRSLPQAQPCWSPEVLQAAVPAAGIASLLGLPRSEDSRTLCRALQARCVSW